MPTPFNNNFNKGYSQYYQKYRDFHQNELGWFFKDDWKIRPSLTLNLGVRWEWYGVPYEGSGLMAAPVGGSNELFGLTGASFADWYKPGDRGQLTKVEFVGKHSPQAFASTTQLPSVINTGAKFFKILHAQFALFKQVADGQYLPEIQVILASNDIAADYSLASIGDFLHLRCQALHEELQPTGQIHIFLTNALKSTIERASIAVVILAEREQSFDVVAGPVQAKRRQQAGRPPIAIEKRMDVDQLELRDPGNQDRMNL
jgi:hypothetical protein